MSYSFSLLLMVMLGGSVGAGLRYMLSIAMAGWGWFIIPLPILLVNVMGSLLMGLLVGWFSLQSPMLIEDIFGHGIAKKPIELFMLTGLLGGFTTFSTFALEAVTLMQKGAFTYALIYILASVILSIAGLALGLWLSLR